MLEIISVKEIQDKKRGIVSIPLLQPVIVIVIDPEKPASPYEEIFAKMLAEELNAVIRTKIIKKDKKL